MHGLLYLLLLYKMVKLNEVVDEKLIYCAKLATDSRSSAKGRTQNSEEIAGQKNIRLR